MSKLRPYQSNAIDTVYSEWNGGKQNVCLVLPTGAGKTVCVGNIVANHLGSTCVIAHRQELVSQISLALAREGVYHRIVGPTAVIRMCVQIQMTELGKSFYDAQAKCGVAGVDTLIRRTDQLQRWLKGVTLWVIDECHHIQGGEKPNKWGTAVALFPNAKGLGVTATPLRADGGGLSRDTDGVMDAMIVGPSMRDLIDVGYLSDYRIFAPPSDLDLSTVKISVTTGDFNPQGLVQATRRSHIMGDVVTHYLRIAHGKRGITFATDVQSARDIAEQFNLAGVPALALDATTPDLDRMAAIRRFRAGEILQIVNVDLFGEGTDIPAVEVVSMARATQSYGLYVQIFGRALRLMEGKTHAIIIDHVGNVIRHGLPDAPKVWSLGRKEKRSKGPDPDVIPVKSCPECTGVYERVYKECPFCGFYAPPQGRNAPELVDGDLHELDAETLANMRKAIEQVDRTPSEVRDECAAKRMPLIGQMAAVNRHAKLQDAQAVLREAISWWAGYRRAESMSDSEAYRRFYHRYGVDVLTAQTLGTKEAEELGLRVLSDCKFIVGE